jgi:hypothetical protein
LGGGFRQGALFVDGADGWNRFRLDKQWVGNDQSDYRESNDQMSAHLRDFPKEKAGKKCQRNHSFHGCTEMFWAGRRDVTPPLSLKVLVIAEETSRRIVAYYRSVCQNRQGQNRGRWP